MSVLNRLIIADLLIISILCSLCIGLYWYRKVYYYIIGFLFCQKKTPVTQCHVTWQLRWCRTHHPTVVTQLVRWMRVFSADMIRRLCNKLSSLSFTVGNQKSEMSPNRHWGPAGCRRLARKKGSKIAQQQLISQPGCQANRTIMS